MGQPKRYRLSVGFKPPKFSAVVPMGYPIDPCKKCGKFVCTCGFVAALALFILEGSDPPPDYAAPVLTSAPTLGVTGTSVHFSNFPDQITGQQNIAVWPDGRDRGAALGPTGTPGPAAATTIGWTPTGPTGPDKHTAPGSAPTGPTGASRSA
jgi:hypothetical protein